MNKKILLILLFCISQYLQGCSTMVKNEIIPHNGLTMQQIYDQQMRGNEEEFIEAMPEKTCHSGRSEESHEGMRRNEISLTLPSDINNERLGKSQPLPILTLMTYVYPHYVGNEQVYIPGCLIVIPISVEMRYQ